MNKKQKYSNQLLVALFLAITSSTLFCQSGELTFENTPLDEVISAIEEKTDYVFNYEPTLFDKFYFSGQLASKDLKSALRQILYNSPYTFELDQNTVLLYRAEPKTYRICGTIKGLDEEPLVAANIAIPQRNVGHQSDELGFFDFQLTADKNQKVEISYLGYLPISFTVQDLRENNCPFYRMALDKDIWTEQIVIRDYLLDGILQGNDFGGIELKFDQLSKNHSTVEHDILKTVQLLPGISSIDDSATNLQIRGSSPDQNLILWEGAPVYNAGHVFGMISAINPFSVNKVNIYKGAHDPKYDSRVGGIIDISQTDSIQNSFHGSLGTTLTEIHTNLNIPIIDNRLALTVSGRQSIYEFYNSPALKSYIDKVFQLSFIDDLNRFSTPGSLNSEQNLSYNDWNAKLLYQVSDRLNIKLGTYNNQQDFRYAYSFEGDPYRSIDDISVKTDISTVEADLKVSSNWSTSFSFHNSSYNNQYDIQELEGNLLLRAYNQLNDIKDRSFKFANTFNATSKWSFNAGYEFNAKKVYLDLGEDLDVDPDFTPPKEEQARFHNLFLSLKHIGEKIKIDGGLRTTYYQEQDKLLHSPRLNIQYFINEKSKIKIDAGSYHQFISQVSNFGVRQIHVDNPLWILNTTNTQLSQQANKLSVGYVYQDRGWLLDMDAYHNQTTGLSTIVPLLGLVPTENVFSKGSSTATGVDILVKKRWSRLNTWINYSFGIIKNDFAEISETSFFAPNDIRHNVSVVSTYKLKKVQFSLNANYHSGLPYSLPELVPNEEDENAEDPFRFYLEYDNINGQRLQQYVRFDANINYGFGLDRKKKLKAEISLSLINLFNTTNVAAREYYTEYNEITDTYRAANDERFLLGRTPLLMLRCYW